MKQLLKKNKRIYAFACNLYAKLQRSKNGRKADKKALRQLKGKWQGKRCFIIGSGPSLTITDLAQLQGEYCFGANKIFTVFDKTAWRPSFYVISDNDITPSMYAASAQFGPEVQYKFFPANFRDLCEGDNLNALFYNYVGCDTSGKTMPAFSVHADQYVVEGYSVAYVAMQLAVYMGFTEIYLLGLDFSWPIYKDCQGNIYEDGQVKHRFYQENNEAEEISIPNVELMENAYRQARTWCEAHGVQIYNATRGGNLNVFERVDFDTL